MIFPDELVCVADQQSSCEELVATNNALMAENARFNAKTAELTRQVERSQEEYTEDIEKLTDKSKTATRVFIAWLRH